ncbi:MAG: hypothetical protein PWQ70_2873 [Clostridiales bacterium]|nr:hypothetical protein [Clostridiales bacterium]
MQYIKRFNISLLVLLIFFSLSACKTIQPTPPTVSDKPKTEQSRKNDLQTDHKTKTAQKEQSEQDKENKQQQSKPPKAIDYEKVKPNELGEIMVVMYHYFGDKEQEFTRTFDNFRKDLKVLYDKGYRLISLDDFLNNNIAVPAGTTPIIFTFDDGPASQFNLIEKDGKLVVNPESAVGIMMEFNKQYPDFGLEGTFYINEVAFSGSRGTEKERLQYLLELGMDVGNHTFGHTNLGQADPDTIQKVIGKHVAKMKEFFPNYKNNTLSLPYGAYSDTTFDYVKRGTYENIQYKNDSVLLVGWKPSPAPAHKNFYPLKLLRVRAGEGVQHDMYYYLDYFDKNPNMKYISDGDKDTVCFPEDMKGQLDAEKVGNKKVITY